MQKCIEEEPTFSCRAQVDCCWVKVDILPHHTLDTDEYKQHRPLAPGSPHRLHTLYTIASLIRRNCLRHQHTIAVASGHWYYDATGCRPRHAGTSCDMKPWEQKPDSGRQGFNSAACLHGASSSSYSLSYSHVAHVVA